MTRTGLKGKVVVKGSNEQSNTSSSDEDFGDKVEPDEEIFDEEEEETFSDLEENKLFTRTHLEDMI